MKIFDTFADYTGSKITVIVRVLFGLLWLEGASWKNPPNFGLYNGLDLYYWVQKAVDYPVVPAYSWIVENIVLKNFLPFGWAVFIVELTLGIGFLLGIKTRILALIALGQTTAITLSVLNAPNEWPWSYYLMFMVAGMLFINDSSDSKLSVDYWLKKYMQKKTAHKKN